MNSTYEIRRQAHSRRSPPKGRHFQPHRRMRGRRSGRRCPLPQGQAPRLRSDVRLAPAKRKRVTYQTDIGLGETLGGQGAAPEKLAKGETSGVLRRRPPAGQCAYFGESRRSGYWRRQRDRQIRVVFSQGRSHRLRARNLLDRPIAGDGARSGNSTISDLEFQTKRSMECMFHFLP
jgi:hypothetical protein